MRLIDWLSRSTPPCASSRWHKRGTRLALEALEERTLLNNRFVVPLAIAADNATTFYSLSAALTTGGLAAGNIIQIESGSAPGNITDANLDTALTATGGNLTIRGNPAVAASELPAFGLSDAVTVGSPNFTLDNVHVNLLGGNVTFLASATGGRILRSILDNQFSVAAADGVLELQSSGAIIRDCVITSYAGAIASNVIQVSPVASAANQIIGNTLASPGLATQNLLEYVGAPVAVNDVVRDNTFFGDTGVASMLFVGAGISALTIQGNTFQDADNSQNAIDLSASTTIIAIRDNLIRLTGAMSTTGIAIQGGGTGTTTSVTVSNNRVSTNGHGNGLRIGPGAGGILNVAVEGNDFHFNAIGVSVLAGGGGPVNGIDLGGGALGSRGANNFRGFTAAASTTAGAIVVSAATAAGPVSAQMNLFAVANPETVIFDQGDDGSKANVIATGNLTGNQAFVQALYLEFLHRAGDPANPNDAGGWVTKLNNGATPASVAQSIGRSAEALGFVVDGLYRQFLNRKSDAGGRAGFVSMLHNGGTLENVITIFVVSAEYRLLFGSDGAFVQSLYIKLLKRRGSDSEVAGWVGALPNLARSAVVAAFLGSAEYRGLVVRSYYADILNRSAAPSAGEVAGWVNSGLDLLTIALAFAGSPEFQSNG